MNDYGDFTSWSSGGFYLHEERDSRAETGYTGPPIFENENDFLIVAAAPGKNRFYFGIVRGYPYPWRFAQGPFVARRDNLWERIRSINPAIRADDCYIEFHDEYLNEPSLDHFIDAVTAPPTMPASWTEGDNRITTGEEWKDQHIDPHTDGEEWKNSDPG